MNKVGLKRLKRKRMLKRRLRCHGIKTHCWKMMPESHKKLQKENQ